MTFRVQAFLPGEHIDWPRLLVRLPECPPITDVSKPSPGYLQLVIQVADGGGSLDALVLSASWIRWVLWKLGSRVDRPLVEVIGQAA